MLNKIRIMNANLLKFALVAFTAAIVSACGGEAVDLKLNLAKGDVFETKIEMDQHVTTSAMGMNMNIDQKMEINQTLSVEDVKSDGNVLIKTTMKRFYMKQSMPMMGMPINVEYDTDKPEKAGPAGETMGQYFSKMKDLVYTIEMNNRGKVLNSDVEEMYKKLGLDSMTQKGGGTSGSGNNSDQYMNQLPDKPVKKGDSYTVEINASSLSPIGTKNTYTVKEIKADVVIMDVKTEFVNGESTIPEMKMDVKGEQTGTVEIDRKTGMTIKSELKQNLDMTITSAGLTMPTKTSGTIKFTSTKK